MMRRRGLLACLTLIASLSFSSFAEARLENTKPSAELPSQVTGANLILAFSAPVDVKASVVDVRDSRNRRVDIGGLRLGENGTDVEIPLQVPLQPGDYAITWTVISVDGIELTGGYNFTVHAPLPSTPTVAQQ